MLAKLIDQKIKSRNISIRTAAQEIGTSHTTLHRVIDSDKGERVDLPTLIMICNWLGVKPSTALDMEVSSEDGVLSALTAIVQSEPKLARLFSDMATDLRQGKITVDDVSEILAYAQYRLRIKDDTVAGTNSISNQGG